jgi:glycosyltransferase involved in cell wall biosynthesis
MPSLSFSLADQNVATTKSIGIFNFSTQLISHLVPARRFSEITIFSNRTVRNYLRLAAGTAGISVVEYDAAIRNKIDRIWWDQRGVYKAAVRAGHDWLFLPKGFSSFVGPCPVKLCVYVHDTMFEFYRLHYPKAVSRFENWYFVRSLRATLQHADVLLTNTEFSKRELESLAARWGLPCPKVVVAGYGFQPGPASAPGAARKNAIILFLSGALHKRSDLALQYVERWRQESAFDGTIECLGNPPASLRKPEAPAWNWRGRVPPDETRQLMREARAVLYFSEFEGFGMPPVESTLDGACAVYSDLPPIREVMGEAGFAFDNLSYPSFAEAMEKALRTPAEQISKWADALLARHNWETVSTRLANTLSEYHAK